MEVTMSDSNKQKQEIYLSVKETAEKLRTLADELDRGVVTINDEKCSIAADTEVKIGLKAKGGTFSSKLKFKLANRLPEAAERTGEPAPSMEPGDEDYRDLKKCMAKDFKVIKKSCMVEKAIPQSELVERFYQDSKAMCTYANKGEEFYETFLKQAGLLYDACKNSDLKAMSSAVESLARSRSDCHEKHK